MQSLFVHNEDCENAQGDFSLRWAYRSEGKFSHKAARYIKKKKKKKKKTVSTLDWYFRALLWSASPGWYCDHLFGEFSLPLCTIASICSMIVALLELFFISLLCKIKVKKDCLMKQRTHKITKIGDSVWLSLFICNTVVCETAYAP